MNTDINGNTVALSCQFEQLGLNDNTQPHNDIFISTARMDALGALGNLGLLTPAASANGGGVVGGTPSDPSMADSALDFSRHGGLSAALAGLTNSPTPAVKPNTGDPMRLWYTVDTDPRTAKKISLDALNYNSIDQSVYIMLQVDCPFPKKFDFINIQDLVFANLRNGMSLMELSDCLRVLAKYAKELLKPSRERYKHWNKIPFSKSGVAQKWTRMEGTGPILHQLGYTHETSKGYVFPLTSYGPPLTLLKVLALELAMAAAELSVFYNNRHPKAEVITDMLYSPRASATGDKVDPTASPTPTPPPPPDTRNGQGISVGSFNVMDLLSPSLKTIRDNDDYPDNEGTVASAAEVAVNKTSGGAESSQQQQQQQASGPAGGGGLTSSTGSLGPRDFSVGSRKRKEMHWSEPTDLTTTTTTTATTATTVPTTTTTTPTNARESRKAHNRSTASQRRNDNASASSTSDLNNSGAHGRATQIQQAYASAAAAAAAQDFTQARAEMNKPATNVERQDLGPSAGLGTAQQEHRHGAYYQEPAQSNYQDSQTDFRLSYPSGQFGPHRFQHDSAFVSSMALPNLSIFGDMFSNIGADHKD